MKYSYYVESVSIQQLIALNEVFPGIEIEPGDECLYLRYEDDRSDPYSDIVPGYKNDDCRVVSALYNFIDGETKFNISTDLMSAIGSFMCQPNVAEVLKDIREHKQQHDSAIKACRLLEDAFDDKVTQILNSVK